jgi:predicted ArsR family transcriptional regulator
MVDEDFGWMIEAIGHQMRFDILAVLINHDDLSLTRLAELLKTTPQNLQPHVKKLELGGLVQNFFQKREGRREYSFYQLTNFGQKIVPIVLKIKDAYNEYYKVYHEALEKEKK